MDERIIQFRVGVMVLATLIITAILIVMFNGQSGLGPLFRGSYTVKLHFREAPRVTANTPVRKSGILIGRVSEVRLNDEIGGVDVFAKIDADRKLRRSEVFRISTSLLGDAEISVKPPREADASMELIKSTDTPIVGEVQEDPAAVLVDLQRQLTNTVDSVTQTSENLGQLSRQMSELLRNNEDQIAKAIDNANITMQKFQVAIDNANQYLGDPAMQKQVRDAVAELPHMMEDARTTVNEMGRVFDSMNRNLENIEALTEPLGQRAPELLARLDSSTKNLDQVLADMVVFTDSINSGKGTLGRLAHDPELYEHLVRASKNVDELTRQLKPIMCDVRVFTDKIARHPGIVVRDAVRPGVGIK